MAPFNHHLLVLAREARALTQGELAEAISLRQGTLSKYETGMLEPSPEVVDELAVALGYPASFFFQNDRPYGFPPYHYRKRKKLSAKTLGRVSAEMNIRRMHIKQLGLSFTRNTNGFIPEFDPDEYRGRSKKPLSPDEAARAVREMWMLPRGPIQNMVELLEENGAIVVPCDFGTDLLDALSQRIDGMPVLVYVNINAPMDRLRLTLAHELGHMVLHTTTLRDDDEMEKEADAFAGAFLLPAEDIKPQLRRGLDLRHLANMKSYWKVSMAAIAVRADRLNLVTPYQMKLFFMEMGRLGYRRREPNEPPREEPKLLKQMIAFHRNKLGYSTLEMCKLLHVSEREYETMYGPQVFGTPPPRPQLRVVK
jgi:Zn-dependent peptidase ImmA (M78 family)/transcriptional regulator with XRE-family HTH domain